MLLAFFVVASFILSAVVGPRVYRQCKHRVEMAKIAVREFGVLGLLKTAGIWPDPPVYKVWRTGGHIIVEIPKMRMSVIYNPDDSRVNAPYIVGHKQVALVTLTPPIGHGFNYSPNDLGLDWIIVGDMSGKEVKYTGDEKVVWDNIQQDDDFSDFEE